MTSRRRWAGVLLAALFVAALTATFTWAGRIVGTPRANVLRGTAKNDRLDGRGGNDIILGLAGNDVATGGPGADRLFCGEGRDVAQADALDIVASAGCEAVDTVAGTRRPRYLLARSSTCRSARRPKPHRSAPGSSATLTTPATRSPRGASSARRGS